MISIRQASPYIEEVYHGHTHPPWTFSKEHRLMNRHAQESSYRNDFQQHLYYQHI